MRQIMITHSETKGFQTIHDNDLNASNRMIQKEKHINVY